MKKFLTLLLLSSLTFGLATSAEARRLGGGLNLGKQRSTPAMSEASREAPREMPRPAAAPAPLQSASPAPSAFAPGAQPRPGFFNRWGGVIAGVGAGALLGSMLGGHLGGFGAGLGGLINILLIVGVLYLAFRFFVSRRSAGSNAMRPPMQFAGAQGPSFTAPPFGGPSFDGTASRRDPVMAAPARAAVRPGIDVPPGFEIEPFVRQAQSSFLRLQAANDDRDLADLRDTTTPEVYAELAMQIRERGDVPQKTDVVSLDAQLLEVVIEGEQMIASLRYSGLIRESVGAEAVPFDEVWHLRRSTRAANDPWLIAGIQQMA